MKWAHTDEMATLAPLPEGYHYERLERSEIPALIAAIQTWHPDISVGAASCYLREDFYSNKVFLDGEAEKDVCVLLFKCKDELVGMWSFEQEPEALAIYGRLMIIAPAHRGSKLASSATAGTERMGRAMGAEFMYVMATLKNPYMQLAMERAGYQLLGFTPGYDREIVEGNMVKRVYEAVFAEVLVPEHALLRPDPKNLTPKTKALFDLLFPV
jgi:hypothetical protein